MVGCCQGDCFNKHTLILTEDTIHILDMHSISLVGSGTVQRLKFINLIYKKMGGGEKLGKKGSIIQLRLHLIFHRNVFRQKMLKKKVLNFLPNTDICNL